MKTDSMIQGRPIALYSGILAFVLMISIAAAAPVMPHGFNGTAQINGRPVPAGSVITAEVGGIVRGSVTLSEDGIWGQTPTADPLVVQNAQNGDTIYFYVQTLQMTNRIQAEETAVFDSGSLDGITLTFNGEEILKSSDDGDDDDSGSNNPRPSGSDDTYPTPGEDDQVPENPAVQGATIDLELSGSGSSEVEMNNKDTLNLIMDGSEYGMQLKSMSDFSVLFDYQGENIVIGVGESREIDLNGDFVTDVEVTLSKIEDGKAFLTLSALEKSIADAGVEGITGFMTANMLLSGTIIIIIIAAIGGSAYILKRRGS